MGPAGLGYDVASAHASSSAGGQANVSGCGRQSESGKRPYRRVALAIFKALKQVNQFDWLANATFQPNKDREEFRILGRI